MREHEREAPLGYPEVHHLTAPCARRPALRGTRTPSALWALQAHALAAELPAGELVRRLADEAREAIDELRH